MRRKLNVIICCAALLCASVPMWGQAMAQIKGKIIGQDGQPMVGAKIELRNLENGQKYNLKSDKKGEFFSIGIASSPHYDITVYDANGKSVTDGPVFKGMPITLAGNGSGQNQGMNMIDINFQQMMAQQATGAPPPPPGQTSSGKLTPEQQKAIEAQQKARAEQEKEVSTVKNLNTMIASAKTASDAGNIDQAVQTMQQAVQTDATRDVLWAQLGSYELAAMRKPGIDKDSKTKLATEATEAYNKAIELCNGAKPAPSCKDVASYHNNLGQALAFNGKVPEAVAEYEAAAKLNPTGAGQYYFNEGAILTNIGKTDDANTAFDKAIAADPTRADAYYQKGVNMLAKATLDKEGKMIPPPGTKENIEKYLELAPTGPNAESAKQLLEAMGAKVETSFGKGKKK
jgi:tetratricopeptide (TPR) repeat protein